MPPPDHRTVQPGLSSLKAKRIRQATYIDVPKVTYIESYKGCDLAVPTPLRIKGQADALEMYDGKGFKEEMNDEPKEEKKKDEPLPGEEDESDLGPGEEAH